MAKSYSLNASYQGNYNSTDLSGNPEMIFYKHYVTNILCHSLIDYTCTSTQMSGITKSAFDAYLFTDGKPKATTSCDTNDVAPLIDGKLSLDAILAVRDKRLSETIDHVLLYNGNSNARAAGDMEQTSSTGYGIAKYDNTSLPLGDRNTGNKNYTDAPIFWLSVVYLNYVEACAELGSLTDAQLNGFKQLRARAGLPTATVASLSAINDPANNHGVSSLLWEIRRERRCELMMDNDFRYWDLVRWHQLDKLDSTKYPDILRGANVKNDPSCEADKVGDYIDGRKGRDRAYDKKYYLYPVPSGQSDLNPALLPNNPGW